MDKTYRELERQVAADPSDKDAVERLEQMQIRLGLLPASDEGDNMVTTLLRQRVTLTKNSSGISQTGIVVAVFSPSVGGGEYGIQGDLQLAVKTDDNKLIIGNAEDAFFPEGSR